MTEPETGSALSLTEEKGPLTVEEEKKTLDREREEHLGKVKEEVDKGRKVQEVLEDGEIKEKREDLLAREQKHERRKAEEHQRKSVTSTDDVESVDDIFRLIAYWLGLDEGIDEEEKKKRADALDSFENALAEVEGAKDKEEFDKLLEKKDATGKIARCFKGNPESARARGLTTIGEVIKISRESKKALEDQATVENWKGEREPQTRKNPKDPSSPIPMRNVDVANFITELSKCEEIEDEEERKRRFTELKRNNQEISDAVAKMNQKQISVYNFMLAVGNSISYKEAEFLYDENEKENGGVENKGIRKVVWATDRTELLKKTKSLQDEIGDLEIEIDGKGHPRKIGIDLDGGEKGSARDIKLVNKARGVFDDGTMAEMEQFLTIVREVEREYRKAAASAKEAAGQPSTLTPVELNEVYKRAYEDARTYIKASVEAAKGAAVGITTRRGNLTSKLKSNIERGETIGGEAKDGKFSEHEKILKNMFEARFGDVPPDWKELGKLVEKDGWLDKMEKERQRNFLDYEKAVEHLEKRKNKIVTMRNAMAKSDGLEMQRNLRRGALAKFDSKEFFSDVKSLNRRSIELKDEIEDLNKKINKAKKKKDIAAVDEYEKLKIQLEKEEEIIVKRITDMHTKTRAKIRTRQQCTDYLNENKSNPIAKAGADAKADYGELAKTFKTGIIRRKLKTENSEMLKDLLGAYHTIENQKAVIELAGAAMDIALEGAIDLRRIENRKFDSATRRGEAELEMVEATKDIKKQEEKDETEKQRENVAKNAALNPEALKKRCEEVDGYNAEMARINEKHKAQMAILDQHKAIREIPRKFEDLRRRFADIFVWDETGKDLESKNNTVVEKVNNIKEYFSSVLGDEYTLDDAFQEAFEKEFGTETEADFRSAKTFAGSGVFDDKKNYVKLAKLFGKFAIDKTKEGEFHILGKNKEGRFALPKNFDVMATLVASLEEAEKVFMEASEPFLGVNGVEDGSLSMDGDEITFSAKSADGTKKTYTIDVADIGLAKDEKEKEARKKLEKDLKDVNNLVNPPEISQEGTVSNILQTNIVNAMGPIDNAKTAEILSNLTSVKFNLETNLKEGLLTKVTDGKIIGNIKLKTEEEIEVEREKIAEETEKQTEKGKKLIEGGEKLLEISKEDGAKGQIVPTEGAIDLTAKEEAARIFEREGMAEAVRKTTEAVTKARKVLDGKVKDNGFVLFDGTKALTFDDFKEAIGDVPGVEGRDDDIKILFGVAEELFEAAKETAKDLEVALGTLMRDVDFEKAALTAAIEAAKQLVFDKKNPPSDDEKKQAAIDAIVEHFGDRIPEDARELFRKTIDESTGPGTLPGDFSVPIKDFIATYAKQTASEIVRHGLMKIAADGALGEKGVEYREEIVEAAADAAMEKEAPAVADVTEEARKKIEKTIAGKERAAKAASVSGVLGALGKGVGNAQQSRGAVDIQRKKKDKDYFTKMLEEKRQKAQEAAKEGTKIE
ncbi:MAG: hypothetical protein LBU15_04480 [Rickettsiales bacterium]|jgi:hypothetical protein|nr:hypothetical protein [Rickettsiales bacterium]